jgi:FkbM family methyltransferase
MIQLKSLRVRTIQFLINLNENLIFYPRLKAYYRKTLKKSDIVVVDVGVNKGQTIDFFLKISPNVKVIGFEPNNNLFKFLINKYKSNSNIKLFQKGISSQTGRLVFNENIMDETSTFEEVNIDSEYLKKKAKVLGLEKLDQMIVNRYEVDVISLSDFLEENKITEIDVLKIDAEGHEYNCLLGLFKEKLNCKVHYIQLESHNDDMYDRKTEKEMEALLQKNNFSLDAKIKHGFGNLDELVYKRV